MHASRPVRRLLRIACAGAILAAVGACAGPAADELTVLPDGIRLSVYQTRADFEPRRLQVSVANGTGETLTVTRLVLDSAQFADPVEWAKDSTTIRPGATADLPVLLADPVCGAGEPPIPSVTLDFALSDGRAGTASSEATDRLGRLPALMAEDCIAQAVASRATIAVSVPRLIQLGDRLAAEVDLTISPTGSPGAFTIDTALGTVLLSLAEPASGEMVTARSVGLAVDGADAASVLTLTIVPGRCDPHAIAEDKRGTVFPLRVTTDEGATGTVYVASSPEVRAALYTFVRTACGLP